MSYKRASCCQVWTWRQPRFRDHHARGRQTNQDVCGLQNKDSAFASVLRYVMRHDACIEHAQHLQVVFASLLMLMVGRYGAYSWSVRFCDLGCDSGPELMCGSRASAGIRLIRRSAFGDASGMLFSQNAGHVWHLCTGGFAGVQTR